MFGRGGEEMADLIQAGVEVEVVPGITSGIAAPAYAGIPVTHRGLSTSVTFVTGHEDPDKSAPQSDWAAIAVQVPGLQQQLLRVIGQSVGRDQDHVGMLVRRQANDSGTPSRTCTATSSTSWAGNGRPCETGRCHSPHSADTKSASERSVSISTKRTSSPLRCALSIVAMIA